MKINSFFRKKPRISINVKLLAGFDKMEGYDPQKGIVLEVTEGIKLKKAIRQINLPKNQTISYIINGEKADLNSVLKQDDEIFCFFPMAGG
ncbi:hypothetical protein KJ966_25995 [bacterium]|nr:hypothetical protein [bacterium]